MFHLFACLTRRYAARQWTVCENDQVAASYDFYIIPKSMQKKKMEQHRVVEFLFDI